MTVSCCILQGIDPALRREVWKYLLGYFPFRCSDEERMDLQKRKEEEYEIMKKQWQTFTEAQEKNFRRWKELKSLVGKRQLSHTCMHARTHIHN